MDDREWQRILERSDAPEGIIENAAELNGTSLSYLHVDDRHEGAVIAMGFNFRMSPEGAPRKWREQNFNAFEVSLEFTCVRDVKINDWARSLDCLITFSRSSEGTIDVKVFGDEEKISFTAERA
ncbi:Imm50 family immunity protein [Streptomyces fenghuangensis]|uniref:Imm50 family immunity protein n=1 Tax=Streptomyces sp. ICN903 TaxID=2964654 RepID=UPI001EDC177B|nr:Imm50 family immunity protein [Streptomyces sp. ICN903]MCG3042917.1 immunity 50 family protein [Streptomyces sp. ICN903]